MVQRKRKKPAAQAAASAQPAATAGARERVARRMARSGLCSRRAAERLIAEGRVAVNDTVLDGPAVTVGPDDVVAVDGQPLAPPEPARLWRFHKPRGVIVAERDPQGRPTIYDKLPGDLPRVLPVGRLDFNSEGLLLLTNDGGLKRHLELPATGWVRRYRARVFGQPDDAVLARLRQGITVDGEQFAPMEVGVEAVPGRNAWLTLGLREGRNREVRRALEAVGLHVNRLIRVSYGPFHLGKLAVSDVREVQARVVREQLGNVLGDRSPAPAAKGRAKERRRPADKARGAG